MADIIERSLELSVVGVDEASDVFAAIADQVDDLQERFQTAFDGMAAYAEDSASTIADAANSWAPVWISQFEAIETAAADTFSALDALFSEAGSAGAAAGTTVESAWLGTLTTLTETSGVAAEAGGALADLGADGAAAGEMIADAFSTDSLGIDSAAGSIAELDEQFNAAGADGAAAASEIADAFSADNLGIDAANGSITELDTQLKTAGDDAVTAGGRITEAFSSDSLGLDDASGAISDLDTQIKTTADDAAAASEKINGAFDTDSLGLDGASGSIADLDGQFVTAGNDAVAAGEKISGAFGSDSLGLDAAKGSLADLDAQMQAAADDAKLYSGEIDAAFAGTGLTADETAGVAGAGAAGASGKAGAAAETDESALGGFSIAELANPALMTTIFGGLGLAGVSSSIGGIQNIAEFAQQTGESIPSELQSLTAAAGVKVDSEQLQKLQARLETNIEKAIQQTTPLTVEGKPIDLGLGKEGIDPSSLVGAISNTGTGPAAAMQLLNINANTIQGMNAQEQLALIADRLDEIKNVNVRTAAASELLGGRGAANLLPLLENFGVANTAAEKTLASPSDQALIAQLEQETGASGEKGAINYEEQLYLTEVKMESALVELTPVMTSLVTKVGDLVQALEHPLRPSNLETIGEDTGALAALAATWKGVKFIGGKGVDAVKGAGSDLLDNTGDALESGLGKAGSIIDLGNAADLGGKLLGPAGVAASYFLSPGNINPHAETAYGPSASGIEQGYTPAQLASMQADEAAAKRYGLNADALIASQTNESDFLADRYQGSSFNDPTKATPGLPGRGLAQFSPATWEADYRATYGRAPTSDNAAAYSAAIQANVEAHTLKASGLDLAGTSNKAGLEQIVTGFEHPSSDTGDITAGTRTLQAITTAAATADEQTKTHLDNIPKTVHGSMTEAKSAVDQVAPELPKDIATALNTLVDDADKYGTQFSSKVRTHMEETRSYVEETKPELNTAGKDAMEGLLEGLESEEGPLMAEAQKIANQIESTIRAALDSHSPSEAMADVGRDIMAGLTLGIDRHAQEPALAASRAATGVISASSPATGGAGAASQPLQITIPVTLDGRQIGQAACEYINGQLKLTGNIPARV